MQQLGNPCYQLLKEFYYNHLSMEQIAEKLGYNSRCSQKSKIQMPPKIKKDIFETNEPSFTKNINL